MSELLHYASTKSIIEALQKLLDTNEWEDRPGRQYLECRGCDFNRIKLAALALHEETHYLTLTLTADDILRVIYSLRLHTPHRVYAIAALKLCDVLLLRLARRLGQRSYTHWSMAEQYEDARSHVNRLIDAILEESGTVTSSATTTGMTVASVTHLTGTHTAASIAWSDVFNACSIARAMSAAPSSAAGRLPMDSDSVAPGEET